MENGPDVFLLCGLDQRMAPIAHSYINTLNLKDHGHRFNTVHEPTTQTSMDDVPISEAQ